MKLVSLPLLYFYPVKMNTSRNPPSLLFCGSGCTLTSSTSYSRRIRNGLPNKGEGTKNKKRHAKYIRKFCEFGHATVPYGIGTQGHAVGTNQRGKGPSDCYSDEHTTCTGTKGQKLVSRKGGNFKKGLRQSPDTSLAQRNKCYPTLTSIYGIHLAPPGTIKRPVALAVIPKDTCTKWNSSKTVKGD